MLIAFFLLFGVMYSAYDIYDEYSAQKEAEAAVTGISNQIRFIAITAPEYKAKKRIEFPENIHGEPYIFTLDSSRYNVKVTLLGKYSGENITEFAMLPEFKIKREGFNKNGEVSVGGTFDGMDAARAIIVEREGGNTVIKAVV